MHDLLIRTTIGGRAQIRKIIMSPHRGGGGGSQALEVTLKGTPE